MGFCVCYVLTESTLPSSLNVNDTMATPPVTKANLMMSTAAESLATSVVSDATTIIAHITTTTTTMAETTKTPTADIVNVTEGEQLVGKTSTPKTTVTLSTNSKLHTVETNSFVTTARPPSQRQATASSTLIASTERHNTTQSKGSSSTTVQQHRGPQLTPSPSPLGVEVTQGQLEAMASSQTTFPRPKLAMTEGGMDSTPFNQRTEMNQSVHSTSSTEKSLTQDQGYTDSSMPHTGFSTQARSVSTEMEKRESRTNSMTTQNSRRYDAIANMTSSVRLKLTTDGLAESRATTITTISTTFTTHQTEAATVDPSAASHTSMGVEIDISNISLSVNSTPALNISIKPHSLATTTLVSTGGLRPEDLQTETQTNSTDVNERRHCLFQSKRTCILTVGVLSMAASLFLGLSIFLWVRLSAVRKRQSLESDRRMRTAGAEKGGVKRGGKESLWLNPQASVDERVEFWYANGTMTHSSKAQRGAAEERRRERRSERKGDKLNGSLWRQPKVTMADITEFWYGRERPMGWNHQTIPEEEEA